jgi:hypothetical protein
MAPWNRDENKNNIMKKSGKRTARTTTSTPPSTFDRPIKFAIQVAKLVVSSVVVLYIDVGQPTGTLSAATTIYPLPSKVQGCRKRDNPMARNHVHLVESFLTRHI